MTKEEKYIDLILNRCLNFSNTKSLFISYRHDNKDFVNKIVIKAKIMNINDIYLEENNIQERHELYLNTPLDEIEKQEYFNKKIWDVYAEKNACFLMIDTSYPGFMSDIDSKKIALASKISRESKPLYRKKQLNNEIPWCIAAMSNKIWAKILFPKLNEEEAYDKLLNYIYDMCMIDGDPINNWNVFLEDQNIIVEKLNKLEIKKVHYKNSLGTDLIIGLPKNVVWESAGDTANNVIFNMPSYEIFTTPDYRTTEGIVYSSKPLIYGGKVIDKFYLKFDKGKVIDYKAEVGMDALKEMIEIDEFSSYLGEVALVNHDSPISNTGLVFQTTLFDENASCHLALGAGFNECIKDYKSLNEKELKTIGVNPSKSHVDFMIGTSDLNIEAETKEGKVYIFKDGNIDLK